LEVCSSGILFESADKKLVHHSRIGSFVAISMNSRLRRFQTLFISFFCAASFIQRSMAQSIYEDYTFVTIAGPVGGIGSFDGPGNLASFNNPSGVARDASGNLYVADFGNNTIRKIAPDGTVTTVAGLAGVAGSANGLGAAARFNSPFGIAVDGTGNIFVTDFGNRTIRKISPSGLVSTLAGAVGSTNSVNGIGSEAHFRSPRSLAIGTNNNIYVTDTSDETIRQITPNGTVTTFAGSSGTQGSADKKGTAASFTLPIGIAADAAGNLYVADTGNHTIRKITVDANVSTLAGLAGDSGADDGTNGTARFRSPNSLVVDGHGTVFVADTFNDTIRKITPAGVVTTLVGSAGKAGDVDSTNTVARFQSPIGIVVDENTNLFVADSANHSIRKVSAALAVTTFAGATGSLGSVDATGTDARFNHPLGSAFDSSGNLYIADQQNITVRKMTPDGAVSTLAGTAGVTGTNDGPGLSAHFNNPSGLATDRDGNVYLTDSFSHTIRKITPLGDVSTFAGAPGTSGATNGVGSAALFKVPFGIAVDSNGVVFVGDSFNQDIRKIAPDGTATTFAGSFGLTGTNDGPDATARFNFPQGVALDGSGNVYVLDEGNFTIRQISPAGQVSTFAGIPGVSGSADGPRGTATFNLGFGLASDASGNVFVADDVNGLIRKISPSGNVTTIGGSLNRAGSADGTGEDALFNTPQGISVDNHGNVYVSDTFNNSIRKGYPALPDRPVVDLVGAHVGVTRHFSVTNLTTTSWSWKLVRRPDHSTAQLIGANTATPSFTPDVEDIYVVQFQGWDNSGHTVIKRLTLYADDTAPSVTITNPVPGQISSNGVFTARGTATDNFAVSNVWVQINSGAWIKAVGTTNWSADVIPGNGTNTVRAYAEDFAGNVSQTNAVDFVYGAPLTVVINGGGTVTPNLNGQLLEIGKSYSMTAQAGAGCSFVSWTGSLTTTNTTLTFVMDTNLTFIANFTDPIRPTLVITSPQNGSHVSNAVFTATGTAADNGQLATVFYRLNGGNWIQATNTSNWTAGLALSGSANTLEAYAMDTFTNVSITNSVAFTYVPSSQITVHTTGQGTIAPNYDGWLLEIGKSYTMTAKPGFNSIFAKWTDDAGNTLTTAPALTFTVQSNLTVRANFVSNPFPLLSGPFAGLFYDTNNIETTNSGFISLTLASLGSFSSKIQLTSGQKISMSGHFTTDGTFSNSVAVKGSTPLIVQFTLDSANQGQISGSISGAGWAAQLFAVRALFSPVNPAPQANKKYTLVIPGGDDSSVRPGGNGFGTIAVDVSGNVTLSGTLADGAKVKQKTFMNKQSLWPLFAAPYKNQGAIFGWMTFVTNQVNTDLTGTLYWFRNPQPSASLYPAGFNFPGGISALGSLYAFTNGTPLLNLPSGGVSVLQFGNPLQSYTNNFTLGADNKITSANGLKATITTVSGLFKGTAISLGNSTSVPINGVLLPKQNSGFGYFLSNGRSGAVYLGP
jgi:sugar lactone lactonase YvrE